MHNKHKQTIQRFILMIRVCSICGAEMHEGYVYSVVLNTTAVMNVCLQTSQQKKNGTKNANKTTSLTIQNGITKMIKHK